MLVLILLVVLTYAPTFGAHFVDIDDTQNLVDNPFWHGFSAANLHWMWTTPHMGHYHPLTWMSFALDHVLWGGTPQAMHVVNVALHAIGTCVLLLVAERTLRAVRPSDSGHVRWACSALAAGFWSLHPLRCESVCWLTERRDVLSGVLFLASILYWFQYVQEGRRQTDYGLSIVLLALSLLAKAWGITFFALLVILDVLVLRRLHGSERASWRTILVEKIPFAFLGGLAGAAALWAQSATSGTLRSLGQHGVAPRVAQAAYGTWFYTWKSLLPFDLRPMIVVPEPFDPLEGRFVLAMVFAVTVTVAALLMARSRPAVAAIWLAFLVVVAPVSGITQAGFQLVADRYTYLACVPFAIALAALVAFFVGRFAWVAGCSASVLLVGSAWMTRQQAATWHDTETLWRHALIKDATETHALSNLASLRTKQSSRVTDPAEKRRLVEEGLAFARRARVRADLPQLVVNLAVLLEQLADLVPDRRDEILRESLAQHDRAREMARRAEQEDPQWYVNRAAVLFKLGRTEEAIPDLERNVMLRPDHVYGLRSLALAWNTLGHPEAALPLLERAVSLAPEDAGLRLRHARTLSALGRSSDARASYQAVVRLAELGNALSAAELEEARQRIREDSNPGR